MVSGIAFPECMRWRDGQLWFSDVLAGKVYRWDPQSSQIIEVAHLPCMAGGLGWTKNGELLVVEVQNRKVVSVDKYGGLALFLDLSDEWEHPANDMLVDTDETIWIGGYGYDPETEAPQVSSLARYRSGVLDFPVGDLVFPNGIARIDERHLVVAETFADRLAILETLPSGEVRISKRIELPSNASPDGLTMDVEGNIWVASAFDEAVLKVNPKTGEVERAIEIPGKGVFDCTFGGEDMATLFIATSDKDESRILIDLPGEILALSMGVQGKLK